MNAGVELLLERMKTNPEEFLDHGKWESLINRFEKFLSEEDAKVLGDAINELMQQRFTEMVLEELVDPKSQTPSDIALKRGMLSGGATPVRSSVTLNNTNTITNVGVGGTWGTSPYTQHSSTVEHMIAHIEALKKENESKKKSKTIFGKLFNYQ